MEPMENTKRSKILRLDCLWVYGKPTTVCRRNTALQWLPMTFCSMHRWVSLRALITNASDCIRINTETHKWTMWRIWGTWKYSVLNKMSSQSLPPSLRHLCRRGGQKIIRTRMVEDSKEIVQDRCTFTFIGNVVAHTRPACTGSSQTGPQNWEGKVDMGFNSSRRCYLLAFTIGFLQHTVQACFFKSSNIITDLIGRLVLTWKPSIY